MYIIASGAVLKDNELGVIARNISNANTFGYKKDTVTFKSYLLPKTQSATAPKKDERVMVEMGEIISDYSDGTLLKTGNTLDIAIDGEGFIALEGNRYTRRGDLRIDSNGTLINYQGLKVVSEGGQPIVVPKSEIIISRTGEIEVDNTLIGKIKVVNFTNKGNLVKTADSIYTTTEKPLAVDTNIRQGYLESSNVDAIKEMVKMISVTREFEVFQKMVNAYDEAVSKASNEIARI